jgi:hypothetical protein
LQDLKKGQFLILLIFSIHPKPAFNSSSSSRLLLKSIMKFVNTLFVLLAFLSFTSALDQPQSYLRGNDVQVRKLSIFGQNTCARQLSKCQTANQLAIPPISQWVTMLTTYLGGLDGNPNDSLISDLIDTITNVGTLNFATLPQDIAAIIAELASTGISAAVDLAQSLALQLTSAILVPTTENIIGGALGVITTALSSTLGPIFQIILPPIQTLLTLLSAVSTLMPTNNSSVVATLAVEISSFTSKMVTRVAQLLIPRDSETQASLESCVADLLDCDYNAMISEVIPAMIGEVLTITAMDQSRRRAL